MVNKYILICLASKSPSIKTLPFPSCLLLISINKMRPVNIRLGNNCLEVTLGPVFGWWLLHETHDVVEVQLLELVGKFD
jgi:hypothetical protein